MNHPETTLQGITLTLALGNAHIASGTDPAQPPVTEQTVVAGYSVDYLNTVLGWKPDRNGVLRPHGPVVGTLTSDKFGQVSVVLDPRTAYTTANMAFPSQVGCDMTRADAEGTSDMDSMPEVRVSLTDLLDAATTTHERPTRGDTLASDSLPAEMTRDLSAVLEAYSESWIDQRCAAAHLAAELRPLVPVHLRSGVLLASPDGDWILRSTEHAWECSDADDHVALSTLSIPAKPGLRGGLDLAAQKVPSELQRVKTACIKYLQRVTAYFTRLDTPHRYRLIRQDLTAEARHFSPDGTPDHVVDNRADLALGLRLLLETVVDLGGHTDLEDRIMWLIVDLFKLDVRSTTNHDATPHTKKA